MSRPFKRSDAQPGDRLVCAYDESVEVIFKGVVFEGHVVATWVVPPENGPLDLICRQRDLRIP